METKKNSLEFLFCQDTWKKLMNPDLQMGYGRKLRPGTYQIIFIMSHIVWMEMYAKRANYYPFLPNPVSVASFGSCKTLSKSEMISNGIDSPRCCFIKTAGC